MKTMIRSAAVVLALALAFAAGHWLRGTAPSHSPAAAAAPDARPETPAAASLWTCSMHPQVRQPRPGKCPYCGMDLIPARSSEESPAAGRRFETSEAGAALMAVQTSPVERRRVAARVRMVGKVDLDETRVKTITARLAGRLDRLYVDYTGIAVRQGDHMVSLYSPDLLSAQQELIQALKAAADAPEATRKAADALAEAARGRLRLWGLTPEQVVQIEQSRQPSDHVTLYAPAGGIVIQKHVQQGAYVEIGAPIYTIADLSQVWVRLDAYESDLVWLRYGQTVEFTTESAPGETFAGRIAFLDPVLNEMTRTVKVRVNVKNDAGRLKPGMFVRASVEARVAASGRVMAPDLAGRWICPMHPEEVKNAAGECGSCGMPLVRTESLGYAPATEDERETPLVIPATAPLVTGERAVVYVQAEAADRPTFEGREVVLGPRAGDYYLVRAGLREGERVVTQGNFKIDSALQIQAKPSMMNPETSAEPRETPRPPTPKQDANEGGRGRLRDTLAAYLALHKALSRDDAKAAAVAVDPLRKAVEVAGTAPPSEPDRAAWAKVSADLSAAVRRVQTAKGIEEMRAGFSLLSEALAAAVRRFGAPGDGPVYVVHCPMAFNDRGADWLQSGPEVENPYFGAAMFRCGVVKETIQPPARGGKAHEHH